MARDIDVAEFARQIGSGEVGRRIIYHAVADIQRTAQDAVSRTIGSDNQMRNLFRPSAPVRLSATYNWPSKDSAVLKFKPAGAFTILSRQTGVYPSRLAASALPAAVKRAEKKVERENGY